MTTYTLNGFSAAAPIQLNPGSLAPTSVSIVLPDALDSFTWSAGGVDEVGLTYALIGAFDDAYGFSLGGFSVNPQSLDAYVLQVNHALGTTFVLSLYNPVDDRSHLFALGGTPITSASEILAVFAQNPTISPAPVGSGFGPGELILIDMISGVQINENDLIQGGPGGEEFLAGLGNDTVNGMGGDDSIHGGAGDDTIQGGAGTDTAVFNAVQAGAQITLSGNTVTVTTAGGGTDQLTGVEFLMFNDGLVDVASLNTPGTISTSVDQITFASTDSLSVFQDPDITFLANGTFLLSWTDHLTTSLGGLGGDEILGQLYDANGMQIGGRFTVSRVNTGENDEGSSALAALPGGGVVAVYQTTDDGNSGRTFVYLEEFSATGVLQPRNPNVPLDQSSEEPFFERPEVAASSATSVLVVYNENGAVNGLVLGRYYDPTTDSYGPEFTVFDTFNVGDRSVSVLENGNYLVVAQTSASTMESSVSYAILSQDGVSSGGGTGGVGGVDFSMAPPAGPAPTAAQVVAGTDTGGGFEGATAGAALGGGGFVIAWQNMGGNQNIAFQVYGADGLPGAAGTVGMPTFAESFGAPVLAGLPDGSFLLAYQNMPAQEMVATQIGADGVVIDSFVFAGAGTDLSIAAGPDGQFALTWEPDSGGIAFEILTVNQLTFEGTPGNDTLVGNAADNLLLGFAGNDRLDGGTGNDIMEGGLGNDRYIVDSVGDVIQGEIGFSLGGGIDTVESWVSFTLTSNLEILRLQGTANINGTGGFAPEAIVGQAGNNVLDGGGGYDVITAKDGDDTLIGGLGADSLVGDGGADVFDFNNINESRPGQANRDFINGFVHGEDLIDLSGIDANTLTGANDAFDFIGSNAFSGTAGELRYFTFSGGNFNIVEADVDGDGVADMQIFVNLTNTMFANDFSL